MSIEQKRYSNHFTYKSDFPTDYLFLFSNQSFFGSNEKGVVEVRKNYRQAQKTLLTERIRTFELQINSGDSFLIGSPTFSRKDSSMSIPIVIPIGEAIKVYSIGSSYVNYIINHKGNLVDANDIGTVETLTNVYF